MERSLHFFANRVTMLITIALEERMAEPDFKGIGTFWGFRDTSVASISVKHR